MLGAVGSFEWDTSLAVVVLAVVVQYPDRSLGLSISRNVSCVSNIWKGIYERKELEVERSLASGLQRLFVFSSFNRNDEAQKGYEPLSTGSVTHSIGCGK